MISFPSKASTISTVMFYTGQMILDPGVSFNEISDHESHIEIKGKAPNKKIAYALAKKLFHSQLQKDLKFSDIIPFWNKNMFIFILKKASFDQKNAFRIETPNIREVINKKLILTGTCSKEGTEVLITGDFEATLLCDKGKWAKEFSPLDKNLSIIGIKASQRIVNKPLLTDFRSFLTGD